jgi:hypothetical protein
MRKGMLAAAVAAAMLGTGCGGSDDEDAASPPAVAETTAAETTAETTPPAETTAAAPAGDVTPAGSTLQVGETATIDYEDTGGSGRSTLIAVTPESIEEGSIDDFKNIDLDEAQQSSTPYYVRMTVENVGKGDLSGTEPGSYINGVDDRGQDQNELIFFGEFDACPDADPESFKPGESYETCLTYLMPGGGAIEGLRWIMFDEKTSKSNIDWRR